MIGAVMSKKNKKTEMGELGPSSRETTRARDDASAESAVMEGEDVTVSLDLS